MDNRDSKRKIIQQYIRYGDRQAKMSSELTNQIKEAETKLREVEKTDITENSDYDDLVSRLQTLYYNSGKFKFWERYYTKFRGKLEKELANASEATEIIVAGSAVRVKNESSSYLLLIVPEHLGNRRILALGVDSALGRELLGKRNGDTVTLKSKNITYKIEGVY